MTVGATTAGTAPGTGPLRPLGVGETLDTAIKLYRYNAVLLWKAVAVVVVPLSVLQFIVRLAAVPSNSFVHDGTIYTFSDTGTSSSGTTAALIITALIGVLANLLATGAVFKLLVDHYLGRSTDWRESIAFARSKLLSLIWLAVLASIIVVIGFILLVLPGIWVLVSLSVAVPALMLEGVGGFAALRRSFALVRGRWWATFARLLAGVLLFGVAAAIIDLIANGISSGLSVSSVALFLAINAALAAVASILTTPLIATLTTTIYMDLRVRKEALDLELLTSEITTTVPETMGGGGVGWTPGA